MSLYKAELLRMYASNLANSVDELTNFQALRDANDHPTFHDTSLSLRSIKTMLEKTVEIHGTNKEKVLYSLKNLSGFRCDENEFKDCASLIKLAYYPDWDPLQQAYYAHAKSALSTWGDIFLSFTTRNDIVNTDHHYFIGHLLPDPGPMSPDIPRNLLAEGINNHLKGRGLTGFFYPDHEGGNDDVQEKLLDACKECFVFVQIVQGTMFANAPNFCFFEYKATTKWEGPIGQMRLFILAEPRTDLLDDEFLPANHVNWHTEVTDVKDPVELLVTPLELPDLVMKLAKNRTLVEDKIVKRIKRFKKTIFDNVPEDV